MRWSHVIGSHSPFPHHGRNRLGARSSARPYRAPSLDTEGFIHLSTSAQWRKTAARFFKGQQHLVLLELDPTGLDVRFEPADGDHFPHLYGALPISAVLRTSPFAVTAMGEVVTALDFSSPNA